MKKLIINYTMALCLAVIPALALAIEGKLTIVTSYPPDTTNTFKKFFEAKYPGIQVEMLKKKTTAGIKYLQETAANNTSDMFWASTDNRNSMKAAAASRFGAPFTIAMLAGTNVVIGGYRNSTGNPEA